MRNGIDRRGFLKGAGYAGAGVFAAGIFGHPALRHTALAQSGVSYPLTEGAPLREHSSAKGLFFGAAASKGVLTSDAAFSKRFTEECSMLVPEWELKWRALRPSETDFDFKAFDWLINFTQRNNLLFRGHNLAWHESIPSWFERAVNKRNAERYLVDHINTVVGRHAGKVHSWDVVNEPIAVWEDHPYGLRSSSPWYKLLGQDYIDMAFYAAAEADGRAMLVLNQNRVEEVRRGADETRKSTLKLLRRMKSGGVPVHAFGIEAHLGGRDAEFDERKFRAFLGEVADLDLKIIITELDVADNKLPKDITVRDRMVADIYDRFLSAALAEEAVTGVLTWGLSDRYTWLSKHDPRADNMPVRPLPLDADLNRKPAWEAVARAFDNAPAR